MAANDATRGGGWIAFAGIMIAIVGVLNVIYGIGAIGDSKFFVNDTKLVFSSLHAWGWIHLIIGLVQFAAAFAIFSRRGWGVAVGIITASVNAIAALLWIPSEPLALFSIFLIDILVIYGLAAYGLGHHDHEQRA